MSGTVPTQPIRIATRASRLALWQAHFVQDRLQAVAPDRPVEVVHISTIGDRDQTEPLSQLGSFGVFTREVQKAVLDGRADLAVHSLKDLPTDRVEGLTLAGIPPRGPQFDVLILPQSQAVEPGAGADVVLAELPPGARIGTGSLRRRAQLLHARSDLQMLEVRGNVETRLRKLDEGAYDALVLAEAGLSRLDLEMRISAVLRPPLMLPAVGQGALGLECRSDDDDLRTLLERISDRAARAAVAAERQVLADLRAGCHAPLGVFSQVDEGRLTLHAVVLSADGRQRLEASGTAESDDAGKLGAQIAAELIENGAAELIDKSRPTR